MPELVYPYTFLLDTNVIAKWLFRHEADSDKAQELLERAREGEFSIAVADVSLLELGNVLLNTGRLTAGEVRAGIADTAAACGFALKPFRASYLRAAIQVAVECKLAMYDAYLAGLAQSDGLILVTADRRLFDALGGRQEPIVQWLANWRVPEKSVALARLHGVTRTQGRCEWCEREEEMLVEIPLLSLA